MYYLLYLPLSSGKYSTHYHYISMNDFCSFPNTDEKWKEIMEGFYQKEQYPGVVGVVDGSLFKIEKPTDCEGWMSRKGFAAVNMQATVDHNAKFMEYSLRPGSSSDKNLWSKSSLGKNIHSILPPGAHVLGDAGYTIDETLMIPYPITDDMLDSESQYNSFHSKTRITVERAFGLLKGRWRILKKDLGMKTPKSIARTIVACMVLHNLVMDARDDVLILDDTDEYLSCNWTSSFPENTPARTMALAKRDYIKQYLMEAHNLTCE
jgi:hypothetical protein